MPKATLNQSRICSTPTLFKEILNQHDDNIQWNYCASLCLVLYATCFQGACRVVHTPWVSHSTQHLACENRCFPFALRGRRCALVPPQSTPVFLYLNSNLHTFQYTSLFRLHWYLYLYLYFSIYIYIQKHIYLHLYLHIYIYIFTFIYIYMHIYTYYIYILYIYTYYIYILVNTYI